jgi:hypothetical protein
MPGMPLSIQLQVAEYKAKAEQQTVSSKRDNKESTKTILEHDTRTKNTSDFKASISPSEKEKAAKNIANQQEYGRFKDNDPRKELLQAGELQLRKNFLSDARSDFFVINDIPISSGAVSSISVQTDSDVFVAETLRSNAPIVEPKGTGLDMVSVSMSFPNGTAQTNYLRRIIAEIIRHPFVFIENIKIREAIGYNHHTMIFALHNASLRSGGEAVGLIFLDLQLSIFNYKPFSNHYWFNANIPGAKKETLSSVPEALLPDYTGRYSFDYDINKYDEFGFEDLTPSDYSTNTPTVFPANSDAWLYYAEHLLEKIPSYSLSEMNSDYIGLSMTEYQIFQPPSGAKVGTGNVSKIFGRHGQYNKVSSFFNAANSTSTISKDLPSDRSQNKRIEELESNNPSQRNNRITRPGKNTKIYFTHARIEMDFKEALARGLSIFEEYGTKAVTLKEIKNKNKEVKLKEEVRSILLDVADLFPGYQICIIKTIGSGNGPHGKGKAIDLKVKGITTEELFYRMREEKGWGKKKGGAGYYPVSKFCHFDVGKKRWWIDRSGHGEKAAYLDNEGKTTLYNKLETDINNNNFLDPASKTEAKKQEQAQVKQKAEEQTKTYYDPESDLTFAGNQSVPVSSSTETNNLSEKQDLNKREDWIEEMRQLGWRYHDKGGTRNIFFRDNIFSVGGGANPESDMILSAITVNFGHRLAPMKPLGQHAPAWQFMGAGNKTGIFVFSAANQAGRQSLKRFRNFYQVSQENARLFPYIEGAGTLKVDFIDLNNRDRINNVLSLAGIKEIVITNIENSVDSSQGVDIHSLVVSWIAYEIPKEDFALAGGLDIDTKRAIIKQMMTKIYWREVKSNEEQYVPLEEKGKNISVGVLAYLGMSQSGYSGGDNMQAKLTEDPHLIRHSQKRYLYHKKENHRIGPTKDVLVWKDGKWEPNTETKFGRVSWYADAIKRLVSILQEYSIQFPNLNIQRPGSSPGSTWANYIKNELGTESFGILQGSNSKNCPYGFVSTSNEEEQTRIISSVYRDMIAEINQSVIRFVNDQVGDADNFQNIFGKNTWKGILHAFLSEVGECYADLGMPPELTTAGLAKGNGEVGVSYPPDFFIYDDSIENAVLDESNNPKNTENMIRSHLTNEARSIHEYVRKILFGGNSVSQNSMKVRENKSNLNEIFGSEYDYFGIGGTIMGGSNFHGGIEGFGNYVLAWGMNRFSAVLDDGDDIDNFKEYGNSDQAVQNRKIFEDAAGGPDELDTTSAMTPEQKKIDGFLNMALDWSSTTTNFTLSDSSSNTQDRLAVREAAKAYIYSSYTHPKEAKPPQDTIELGPNKDNLNGDSIIAGMMSPYAEAMTTMDPNKGAQTKTYYDPESDLTVAGNQSVPVPSATEEEYIPPAAKNDFTDTFSTYAAGLSTAARKKDLSMRRAYPTFKIFFIDEDQHQGTQKLKAFDDYYSYSSVQEIKIIRSRKVAADLAILRLTNVGDVIITQRFQRGDDDHSRDIREGYITKVDASGNAVAGEKAKQLTENISGMEEGTNQENPFGSMMLQPGVKTQIRLGYAADPDNLETVFVGQIIEVQPTEDNNLVEVVCQGYGAELEAAECGDIDKASPAFSAQSALSAAICMPFVTHFGRREPNAGYNPAEVRTELDGGKAEDYFESLNIFQLAGSVMSAWYHERLRTHNFLNKPQDDNIYAPPVSLYTTGWSRFWDNAAAYRPLNSTVWDIFKEHELRHPGFISSPVPYGHEGRMTMFFGSKGQNYWSKPPSGRSLAISKTLTGLARDIGWDQRKFFTDGAGSLTPSLRKKLDTLYKENKSFYKAFMQSMMGMGGEKAIGFAVGKAFGRYVPFRNYHTYTSEHHILKNSIRANVQGTYNAVEVRFSEDEDIARANTFLWSETLGKVENVLTGDEGEQTVELYKGVQEGTDGRYTLKLNDKMPDHLVRKHMESYPSCITDYMAARYAQGLLLRGLKDVYRGDLIIIGDERVKPYDIVMLQDNKNSMYGPIEVEQVVQIFNSQQGFISIITPDLCIDFNDFTSKGIMDAIIQISALSWAISTDSTMASMSRDYNSLSTVSSSAVNGALAPIDQLFGTNMGSVLGSVMVMHFDQTGSPYIITPLMYGGKPMLGLSLAPKYGNWVSNLWGEFKDWIYDFKEGYNQFDMDESWQEWATDASEWVQEIAGNDLDWDDDYE